MDKETPASKTVPARKLTAAGNHIRWDGRKVPLVLERGIWRARSRTKSFKCDISLGTQSLTEAKQIAKVKLAELQTQEPRHRGTLEEAVTIYLAAPKKCHQDTAEGNVSRLRSMVREAWGKSATLSSVRVERLPDLWPAFVRARQGLAAPDYSTRRRGNVAIVSALRQVSSIFMEALRPHYRRCGVTFPPDATHILWPAVPELAVPAADDAALVSAWADLRHTAPDLWVAVGLARFAGLRQAEILGCRGKWIREDGAAVYVDLRDREEDNFFTKTGRWYSALVLSPDLAEYLLALPPDAPALSREDADRWVQRGPQDWLRPFTGGAKAPLHRLRGLYADHVKRETEAAIAARAEAIRAASANLGHTSTRTTQRHYMTQDGGAIL